MQHWFVLGTGELNRADVGCHFWAYLFGLLSKTKVQ